MKKKNGRMRLMLLVMGGLFFVVFSACRKEAPTVAKIKVVDTDGAVVSNAMVRLYATSTLTPPRTPIVHDTLYTKADGYATFDYSDHYNLGQAGFAVLNIAVETEDAAGEGIIKVEAEKTNNETVIVQ